MAVDTRNKRASILGIGLAAAMVFPSPDGAIGQPDRQHTAYSYPGIDASAQYANDPVALRSLSMSRRTERVLERSIG